MKILPTEITSNGPGVDLSNQPDGLAIKMADPVKDFKYARNAVTLMYDLSSYVNVRLSFAAMEFGDEPHAPPPSPFGDDAIFDGVAVSTDGINWYEVQDLRHLRSDRFTPYVLDLDAAIAGLGLSYGSAFRIRFCQYDNNPAPMDGIFLHGIELTAELTSPVLHLPMDDNAGDPLVHDVSHGQRHQTFLDPGGDPNTAAHAVAGVVAGALEFDDIDDQINIGVDVDAALGAGQDFTISFWWKWNGTIGADFPGYNRLIDNHASNPNHGIYFVTNTGTSGVLLRVYRSDGSSVQGSYFFGWNSGDWKHVVFEREGETFRWYVNSVARGANTDTRNSGTLVANPLRMGYSCLMDDFRVYDRTLTEEQIQELYELGAIT